MTPDEFAKAKEQFLRLIDLSGKDRSAALKLLEAEDANLANEVRSLLDNHRSRTIMQSAVETGRDQHDSTSYSIRTLTDHRWKLNLIGGPWPLVVALATSALVGLMGWAIRLEVRRSIEASNKTQLERLLELERSVIHQWTKAVTSRIESWARSTEIKKPILELVKLAEDYAGDEEKIRSAIADSPAHMTLEKEINAVSGIVWPSDEPPENCQKYAVWNRESNTLTDWNRRKIPEWIGRGCTPEGAAKLNRIFQPSDPDAPVTFIYLPRVEANERITTNYPVETQKPQIQIMTGVSDNQGRAAATLMIRDQPTTDDFLDVVFQGRFSSTGECYLVDVDGWMVMSESRFKEELKNNSVFRSNYDETTDRLKTRVADPGGDVLEGFQPSESTAQWPITKAARGALAKIAGLDTDGYRDYRGRKVIGAWCWDERLQAGIIVEKDYDEAFGLLNLIDNYNRVAWGLPLLCSVSIVVASFARQTIKSRHPPKSIGPYRIIDQIGEGGLGVVYRGEHQLLGRQAAIKLLKKHVVHHQTLSRFEREVRLASRLVHPNAVSIFDYGTSEQGEFYYAMEYIQGLNLDEFVRTCKVVPLDRCLHILIQICSAIREAHHEGLVHRDIKPQNIMVCARGGMPDVVKVLDYGLAKSFVEPLGVPSSETQVVMGTPKYMAPERLESPWLADPRIDIFSIGGIAYFLLLRNSPLLGMNYQGLVELFSRENSPYRTQASEKPFLQFLQLVARCISPEPTLRPESIDNVLDQLRRVQSEYPWKELEASYWWDEHSQAATEDGHKCSSYELEER